MCDGNWTNSGLGRIVAVAVLAMEGLPFTNEVSRVALFGLVLANTNVLPAAVALGAITMLLEGCGALVMADVLDSRGGSKFVGRINRWLAKTGVRDGRLGVTSMTAIALLAGAPMTVFLRHRQEPMRVRSENRAFGLAVAGGISLIALVQGLMIGVGIRTPSPFTVSAALVAIALTLASIRWARRTVARPRDGSASAVTHSRRDVARGNDESALQ